MIDAEFYEDKPSEFEFVIQHVDEGLESEEAYVDYLVNIGQVGGEFLFEGHPKISKHVRYERNLKNRTLAIQAHGTKCKICGFDYDAVYGNELANSYIEVHHIKQLSEGVQAPDPVKDLIPVCANCHRMLHRKKTNNVSIVDMEKLEKIKRYRDALLELYGQEE